MQYVISNMYNMKAFFEKKKKKHKTILKKMLEKTVIDIIPQF